ncbi:hypothetical protein D3C85_1052370 [compost metagenome]
MEKQDWNILEILEVPARDGKSGVLIIEIDDRLYVTPYELSVGIGNKTTGQLKPVICDLCRTWQTGSRAGAVTFRIDQRSLNSITFLCCADLKCSLHVRGRTSSARTSRAQLREDITDEYRVQRLRAKLKTLVERLELDPLIIAI